MQVRVQGFGGGWGLLLAWKASRNEGSHKMDLRPEYVVCPRQMQCKQQTMCFPNYRLKAHDIWLPGPPKYPVHPQITGQKAIARCSFMKFLKHYGRSFGHAGAWGPRPLLSSKKMRVQNGCERSKGAPVPCSKSMSCLPTYRCGNLQNGFLIKCQRHESAVRAFSATIGRLR